MTSYEDSSVYVRLLFGHILQAHCKRGDKWHKSLINLNDCLFNDNGKLVSHGSKPFNFPFDPDIGTQLEGSVIKAKIKNSNGDRVWAEYDLRRCLFNENGSLKWIVNDRFFDIDGKLRMMIEPSPIGFVVALVDSVSGDAEHARRALTAATKATFVTIVVLATASATAAVPFLAPVAVGIAGATSTIVADVTLEPLGKQWVQDFRVSATMPDRDTSAIALDAILSGFSSGVASGVKAFANTPVRFPGLEDTMKTNGFVLTTKVMQGTGGGDMFGKSIRSQLYNYSAKKLNGTAAGAVTKKVINRAYEELHESDTIPEPVLADEIKGAIGPTLLQVNDIRSSPYYIVNRDTNLALDLYQYDPDKEPQIVCNKQQQIRGQKWSLEKGKNGYKIRSRHSGMHVSILASENLQDGITLNARAGAVEFQIYCDADGGFRFHAADSPELVLEIHESGALHKTQLTKLAKYNGKDSQAWLLVKAPPAVIPGDYFLLNSKTCTSLDLYGWGVDNGTPVKSYWLKIRESNSNQRWIIEEGKIGYRIKSAASGTYVGYGVGETLGDSLRVTANNNPVEYEIEGNRKDGYTFYVVDPWHTTLVLDLAGGSNDLGADILFRYDRGEASQKWLVESDMEPAVIEPSYHGALDHLIGRELKFRSVLTKTVLDWSGGNKGVGTLYGWQSHGNKLYQMWTLERGFKGYRLKHPAAQSYVVPERELRHGMLYLTMGLNPMEFKIDGNPQDGYIFTAVPFDPPRALDICGGNPENGTRMCLWPRHGGSTQKWLIQEFNE